MLYKWFIIASALIGAWFIFPVWFPSINEVAFILGNDSVRIVIRYIHFICLGILYFGFKLKAK